MDDAARAEAIRRLDAVEAAHGVKIVYACESGSRAWGFASTDSDYDVRFLYLRPRDWYLSINLEHRRDVIETPIEGLWDVNGWDLRKALKLLRRSNPPLVEWLQSPIVYREASSVAERLRALLPEYFSPLGGAHHYFNMARRTYREQLCRDRVKHKRYFYALRPLLAVCWIEQERGVVPTEFGKLLATLEPGPLTEAIDALLVEKRAGVEADEREPIPVLQEFIGSELDRLGRTGIVGRPAEHPDTERLSDLFRTALDEVWGELHSPPADVTP